MTCAPCAVQSGPTKAGEQMRYIHTVDIAADASVVWAILIDVQRWPEWTASTRQLTRLDDGPLQVGSTARVRQPKGRPMVWTITELEPERSFTWTASTPGLRYSAGHMITPTESGVRAVLSFDASGALAWLGQLLAGARIRRYVGFEADGLKQRAESGHVNVTSGDAGVHHL